MFGFAGGKGVAESVGNGGEGAGVERIGGICELAGEFVFLLAECVELRLEVGESGLELAGLEVARLERLVVAVEGASAAEDLFRDRAALLFERGPIGSLRAVGALECVGDQVAVAVQVRELAENGGFELVAVQPFAVAALAAELLTPGAGVVVVDAAVAFGAHADVGALATTAAHHAGEQEVGAVAAPQRQVPAALLEQRLRCLEGGLVDERLVQAGIALAAPVDAAEVSLVLQDPLDDGGLPAPGRRRRTLLRHQPSDRGRTEPITRIELEHAPHHRRLPLVRDHVLLLVTAVAERQLARRPAALLRAALDPGGDPVDDRRVLELREHRQHLQHHPTRSRTSVERLRRRTKSNADTIELLSKLRQLAHLPTEPVNAIDQQEVDLSRPRQLERRLQAGPVELRSGRPVLLMGHNPPALLRGNERLQPLPLAMQRRRLVLLIRRDPRVQTHTHQQPLLSSKNT